MKSILVIDDEKSIRSSLQGALEDEGYQVATAESGPAGLSILKSKAPEIVLLDIWMPGMDGLETLRKIREFAPGQAVIMMSGHGTIETAVKATKLGAYDFIEKPLSLEKLLVLIKNLTTVQELELENHALRRQIKKQNTLIFVSEGMKRVDEVIQRAAPTTGSVLITGENGTGKEVVAHRIHALSPRYDRPFVEINCAAIPDELIESELFGHEKGAFTGATQLKRGKFDLANGGTIFLDEIGDMSLKTQAKILRILQEQKFERVGGTQTIEVDVRVVAATNKDLKHEIQEGKFREDLYYRLNVIPFQLPPLRKRKEDIKPLAEHFIHEFSHTHGKISRGFTNEAYQVLLDYSWPGNVRELRNLIERFIILTPESRSGAPIMAAELFEHLEREIPERGESQNLTSELLQQDGDPGNRKLKEARQDFEKRFIIKTLEENSWNVSKTASILGIERSHLHKKIKSYGIEAN